MNDIRTYCSTPRHVVLTGNESNTRESPVEMRVTYHNRTPFPVRITQRSGLSFVLPSTQNFTDASELIVRIEWFMVNAVRKNAHGLLGRLQHFAEEQRALLEALRCEACQDVNGNIRFTIEYPIKYSTLKKYGGTIYYREIDTVVSLDTETNHLHPYSEEARGHQIHTAETLSEGTGINILLRIIDNDGTFGNRYINIDGEVFFVLSEKDMLYRNGIYRTAKGVINEVGETDLIKSRYTLEEGEKELKLFRTYEEALIGGNQDLMRKEQLASLEHETAMQKKQIEALKAEAAIRQAEREETKEELELLRAKEEHQRTLERERTKDFYEQRSATRKDTSEEIKFIPTLLIGLGAIIIGIKSLFF